MVRRVEGRQRGGQNQGSCCGVPFEDAGSAGSRPGGSSSLQRPGRSRDRATLLPNRDALEAGIARSASIDYLARVLRPEKGPGAGEGGCRDEGERKRKSGASSECLWDHKPSIARHLQTSLSLSLSLSLSRQPKGIPCRVGSVAGWLHGTIRHLLAAARRGTRDPAVSACSLEAALEGPLEPEARTWSNPERTAVLSDLASVGPMLINRLPPPCREIARLQYLEGATRAEIRTYLRAWRPIGCEEVRRLLRLTHALLRAFGRGRSPAEEWPSGWCGGKNRWLTTPPPAL
jgi:hypothetical protein